MKKIRKYITNTLVRTGINPLINEKQINRVIEKLRYLNRTILKGPEAHIHIKKILSSGQPAAIGKMGDVELQAVTWHLNLPQFYKYTYCPPSFGALTLDTNAGVFPRTEENFHKFCGFYLERLNSLDVCGVWYNPSESVVIKKYCDSAAFVRLTCLEPYFHLQSPWSEAFAGKRILVVHSSTETMIKQYNKRESIWPMNPKVLPDFTLLTLKVPYLFSNKSFQDWFAMFKWLEDQVTNIEEKEGFDIALIGCGAGSMPMAVHVKKLGKIGIHMGGTAQVLFGIKGKRWDSVPYIRKLYNEAWCRPSEIEKPEGFEKLDKGGYW